MKVGFLGAGNMATAIAQGLLAQGVCHSRELSCLSGSGTSAAQLTQKSGIHLASDRFDLFARSDIIVLAFKPQHLETISPEEAQAAEGKLIASALAGRTLDSIRSTFPKARAWVRIMPNTPAKIGKGTSSYCVAQELEPSDQEKIEALLGALGTYHRISEEHMHAATALNGCGPAFFFLVADLLSQSAAKQGLPRQTALRLATETGMGSLELLARSQKSPAELIKEVASPNGVTHALLQSLQAQGLSSVLDNAVQEAVKRSSELSKPSR